MDPHRVPPQGLKDIFRELRSIKERDDPRIAAYSVIDMSLEQHKCSAGRVRSLEKVFDCFQSQTALPEDILGNILSPEDFCTADGIPGFAIVPRILPPLTQRLLLDRLLHRDLSNPIHQTNLHLHYDACYPSNGGSFFTTSPSDVLFKPKDPSVHKELDMNQALQRKLRWMTLGGQYDWTNKVYPAEAPPEFPHDIASLIRGIFDGILEPQAAIVNIYSPGDTLSLHRDVSEKVDQPLVSISLGCECLFLIAVEDDAVETCFKHAVVRLRSGDALIMMDGARFAWHAVPKIFPNTCPSFLLNWPNDENVDGPLSQWGGWMRNKRINLNVRQMY